MTNAAANSTPAELTDSSDAAPGTTRISGIPAETERVKRVRAEQRKRWTQGERVLVEEYLRQQPDLNNSVEAALDLIYGEFVLREELGEKPEPEEYERRFPQYQARLQRLFKLDRALLAQTSAPADVSLERTQTYPGVPADAPEQLTPTAIGKYPVITALDAGGQGLIFRAIHPTLRRDVVIKLSRQPLAATGLNRDRLLSEGRILAELDHPNLARVYDFDVDQDRPFLVMEYVAGRNLEQYAHAEKVSQQKAALLVAQIARALAVAHGRGVIHQDIKPLNILIDDRGQTRLIDFGLARLEQAWTADGELAGSLIGTVRYMPPEQARGEQEKIGPRSDLYALGGVLYFLLTAQPPHQGETFLEVLKQARHGKWDEQALRTAGVHPRLVAICRRALAADPEQRYSRAEDLATALEQFARPALPARWLALAGILLLGGALLAWLAWPAAKQPEKAVEPQRPAIIPIRVKDDCLSVWVWGGKRFLEVGVADVSLKTGNEIKIEARIPPELHSALFVLSPKEKLRLLARGEPMAEERPLHWPGAGKAVPLVGPPGTELVLLVCQQRSPIDEEKVQALCSALVDLPSLPDKSVLQLGWERVRVVTKRGFGEIRDRADPEGEVRQRLEDLREQLQRHFPLFEGVAFSQQLP